MSSRDIHFEKISIEIDKLHRLIEASYIGRDLRALHVKHLARYAGVYRAYEDEMICREGENGNKMGIVLSGRLLVLKEDSENEEHLLKKLGPGSTFGEMSMIDEGPHSATLRVDEASRILIMKTEDFRKLLDDYPRLGVKLLHKIATLLSQRLRQTSGRLVENLESLSDEYEDL